MANVKPLVLHTDGTIKQIASGDYLDADNLLLKSGGNISAGAATNTITWNATAMDCDNTPLILRAFAALPALVDMAEGEFILVTGTPKQLACRFNANRYTIDLTAA